MTNANAQSLYDQLRAAGLSTGAALGVTGNILAESGARPTALGDSGTSHGIAQWRNERWDRLLAWAKKGGRNPNNFAAQSDYLVQDLQTYNGGSLWRRLTQTADTYTASQLILSVYERPRDQSAAEVKRRGDLAINAGLTNAGKPMVNVDPQSFGDTSGSATATAPADYWKGFNFPKMPWQTWGVYAGVGATVLVLGVLGVYQLTKPLQDRALNVAKVAV